MYFRKITVLIVNLNLQASFGLKCPVLSPNKTLMIVKSFLWKRSDNIDDLIPVSKRVLKKFVNMVLDTIFKSQLCVYYIDYLCRMGYSYFCLTE